MHICPYPYLENEFRVRLAPSSGWCTKCRSEHLIREALESGLMTNEWDRKAETWLRYVEQDKEVG